ncbi:hypothetical protein K435DRAFT_813351 [Dendrothele bispora CBS 962.96]|uniref:Uncharacterized protein n=1 Tax=Dendrothele bispora (strain CBS 962.96) TaxID=1314807 RepID=A0A4S8KLU7_DENBC|nr:hypothetical protein K435DRAFT_813351 [Dendrothele bispora CBS 962.96]
MTKPEATQFETREAEQLAWLKKYRNLNGLTSQTQGTRATPVRSWGVLNGPSSIKSNTSLAYESKDAFSSPLQRHNPPEPLDLFFSPLQPRHSQHGPSQDNTLPSLYFHDAQGKEQSASPPQHQPDSDPPGKPLPFDVSAQAEFQVFIWLQVNDEWQTSLADILQGVCELKECVLQQAEKDRAQRSEEHDHIVTCLQQQTEALKRLTDLLESQATS